MASTGENEEARTTLSNTTRVHIAELSPTDTSDGRHIEATVVLVWPYSSATKELSLLLAERDVSLRKAKGQVKVTFHGAVAREVARSKPGIGDKVQLALGYVELVEEQDEVSTPGKKAGFTIHSYRAVVLQVFPAGGPTRFVDFVAPNTSPTSPPQLPHSSNDVVVEFETPASSRSLDISQTQTASGSTARFGTSQRFSSNSFPGSLVDPFIEEDGYVQGRGRKRAKFARYSGAWRLADSDEEIELDYPQDHRSLQSGVSSGSEHVSEVEGVVDITQGPSFAKSGVAEPSFVEAGGEEEFQIIKHTSIEKGAASSIDDRETVEYKSFGQLPSPESEHSDGGESSSSSTDQIMQVERTRMSPAASTSVATPRLEATPSPGLAPVSSLGSRNHQYTSLLGQTPRFGTSARPVEQAYDFFSAPDLGVSDAAVLNERLDTSVPSFHQEVTQTDHERDAELAIPQSELVAQDIDLDALQQQIEIENGRNFPNEMFAEAAEDEDMSRSPAAKLFEPELDSGEQHAPSKTAAAPVSSSDDPIVLDDDDDDENIDDNDDDSDDNSSEGEEEQEVDETKKYGTDDDVIEEEPWESVGKSLVSKISQLDPQESEEVLEQVLRAEPRAAVAADSPSTLNSSSRSAKSDALSEQSENDVAADRDDQPTTDDVAPAPTKSPRFLDGVPDEMLAMELPLLPTDVVDVELPSIDGRPIDILDSMDDHRRPDMEEALTGAVLPRFANERHGAIRNEPHTPQITQINDTSPEDQGKLQASLTHEMYLTPFDSQQLPPEEADQLSVEPDYVLPVLPQTDGPPARRASRRLLEKPRMSDNIHSDYFTPRKPASKAKDPALLENALSSESQIGDQARLGLPSPESAMHIEEGPQRRAAHTMMESRQPTAAGNAPWASSRGVATNMGYYVYLDYLGDYYDQLVDVMAVCIADATARERAKSGPKDFNSTIHLADPSASADNSTTITTQIFRPRKNAIPTVKRGDVVLLRNFKVQTQLHKPFLLSNDESAWAVFSSAEQDAVVTGPPVEFGDLERAFAARLFGWWTNQGKNRYSGIPAQTQPYAGAHSPGIKKSAPQPINLRRSPRTTRQGRDGEDNEVASSQELSPSFNPQSPTFSNDAARSPMTTRSTPAVADPASPTSAKATRSTRSASAAVFATQTKSKAAAPPSEAKSAQLSPPRNSDGRVHAESTFTSNNAEDQREPAQRDPGEDDSTIMSETETSTSSKRRHRHARVSTSLIHELRDGTQWVDIDDFEVVSVSEQETEDDEEENEHEPDVLSAVQPHPIAQDILPQPAATDIPRKQGHGGPRRELTSVRRGRSRKIPQATRPEEQDDGSTMALDANDTPSKRRSDPLQIVQPQQLQPHADRTDERPGSSHSQGSATAATVGAGMVTRSKAVTEHNVHELRDGATYED